MRRRLPDEAIERLRSDKDQGFQPLLARIARWTQDNAEKILAQEPEIDPALSDRQADVWRELLRIADTAGGSWPQRARIAAIELCAKQSDDGDLGIRLLSDIQKIFAEQPERTKWPSQLLVDELNALDEAPWKEINHGRELTTNRLARMLARFEIRTCTLRDGSKTPKGYSADSFKDVFSRYLPSNRNTATNADNSIAENEIKCCGNVSVADVKRNIDDVEGETMESGNFTNDDLAIVASVFQRLIETNKNGLCLANWRLSCAAEGVPPEAFDAAKKYYDQLGVYRHVSRGVVAIGKPETQEAEFTF
jgi:putative DNA primase/helicase